MNLAGLRREHAVALGLGFLALTMGLAFYEPELAPWGDNAQFIVLAKALASGQGLREMNQPDRPVHRKYPAGFPLMLAAVERIKPDAIPVMKGLVLGMFVLSAVLAYWLLLLWGCGRLGALVAVLFCTSQLALQFASEVMSETPYLCFSLVGLLLFEKQEQAGDHPAGRWFFVGAVLATLWSIMVRSVGLTLAGALCLRLAVKRRFGRALILGVSAATTMFTQRLIRGPGPDDYMQAYRLVDFYDAAKGTLSAAGILRRALSSLGKYGLDLIPGSVLPLHGHRLALLLVALIVAVGWLIWLRRGHVGAFYFAGMLALLVVWPRIWAVPRFLAPLLPFTLLFALTALSSGWDWIAQRAARGSPPPRLPRFSGWLRPAAAVGLVVALSLTNLAYAIGYQPVRDPRWQRYLGAMEWLRRNTPAEAVVMCRKPYDGFLHSGRRTVSVTRRSGEQLFFEELRRYGVSYVVVDSLPLPGTREVVIPNIKRHRDRFERVHRTAFPPVYVFRYLGDATMERRPP